jgi:predicted nucleotidyltransferase
VARARKLSRAEATAREVLEELVTLAAAAGLRVRRERLLREVGYHVRSGRCRVRLDDLLLLDRALPTDAQIDILVEELRQVSLDGLEFSDRVRRVLGRAAA